MSPVFGEEEVCSLTVIFSLDVLSVSEGVVSYGKVVGGSSGVSSLKVT